jgi:hypothetical protein
MSNPQLRSFLQTLLGEKSTQELWEELEPLLQDLNRLGWQEMRPWADFFATFKAPQFQWKHLEQRIVTNFLHYRTNYFAVCMAVLALQVLFAPRIVVTAIVLIGLWVYLFIVQKHTVVINESFALNARTKPYVFGLVAFVVLALTGVLERLLWIVIYSVTLCGMHMVFRPRSISAKTNRVYEEMKLNGYASVFRFGSSGESKATHDDFRQGSKYSEGEDEANYMEDFGNMRRRGK